MEHGHAGPMPVCLLMCDWRSSAVCVLNTHHMAVLPHHPHAPRSFSKIGACIQHNSVNGLQVDTYMHTSSHLSQITLGPPDIHLSLPPLRRLPCGRRPLYLVRLFASFSASERKTFWVLPTLGKATPDPRASTTSSGGTRPCPPTSWLG